jgi:hypothetical protein
MLPDYAAHSDSILADVLYIPTLSTKSEDAFNLIIMEVDGAAEIGPVIEIEILATLQANYVVQGADVPVMLETWWVY